MTSHISSHRIAVAVLLAVAIVPGAFAAAAGGIPVAADAPDLEGQPAAQAQSGANTSQQNATNATATVVFDNQTTNGSAIIIENATLPEGGFVAIHGPGYARQGVVSGSAITVSRYLEPGTHHNVTIQFSNGVPGAVSNSSNFSGAYGPLSAVLYRDTNGNKHYDYVDSLGQNDTSYRRGGTRVADQARVVTQQQLDRKNRPSATVTLTNQTATNGTLTVARVRVPRGGWVVVHNRTYLTANDPLTSAVGRSKYQTAGIHRNVTVSLDRRLSRTQRVVAVVYDDTNDNKRYDYLRSGGVRDAAYVNRSGQNATLVTDTAHVSVASPTTTAMETATATPTPSPTSTSLPSPTSSEPTPAQSPSTTDQPPSAGVSASGGMLSDVPVWIKMGLLIVGTFVGVLLIIRWT